MAKATAQQCHALTSYFIAACKDVGAEVKVNRNKARWGFEAVLMDYTPAQAHELIDFYVREYAEKPSIDWFLYNYEKLDEAKTERDLRRLRVRRQMEESKKRAEEWRNKVGNR